MYFCRPEARLSVARSSKLYVPAGPVNTTFTAKSRASSCSGFMGMRNPCTFAHPAKSRAIKECETELRQITHVYPLMRWVNCRCCPQLRELTLAPPCGSIPKGGSDCGLSDGYCSELTKRKLPPEKS